ncbi:MAG: hypothetical protein ACFFAS_00795 [Promethearchaeota archaeon]
MSHPHEYYDRLDPDDPMIWGTWTLPIGRNTPFNWSSPEIALITLALFNVLFFCLRSIECRGYRGSF